MSMTFVEEFFNVTLYTPFELSFYKRNFLLENCVGKEIKFFVGG